MGAIALFLAACAGGGATPGTSSPAASCGFPVPGPRPFLALSYPQPNGTSVPSNIGELIFVGFTQGVTGNATVSMTASSGASVPLGGPTSAPSPMPTPYAVPTGWSGNIPFVAFPVPELSAKTTYTLTYTYADNTSPPVCAGQVTDTAGSFTTQ